MESKSKKRRQHAAGWIGFRGLSLWGSLKALDWLFSLGGAPENAEGWRKAVLVVLSVMPPWLMPALLFGSGVALIIYLAGVVPELYGKSRHRMLTLMGRGYRKRMKALETGAENMLRENKESDRRIENIERLLEAVRAQTVVQLPDGSQKHSESGKSFSGEAIVNKRRSTLEEDFKVAPGAGKIAAHLILQEDDVSEAERILNIFESQPERIDEAYPYVAFGTKLAEQDEMTQAHDALSRLPESARWQVDEAMEWVLSELMGRFHETDA